ncbi:MAG: HAMP domain-containing protein [Gammaproteobacteria bacterium]|nr:HAMP domain-containing protein [Gammaproteobacteria bacterium]
MPRWLHPPTLLGRTIQALAIAFLLFAAFAAIFLQVTLVQPHTRQAADDLAALLVLTAQIWVELPPTTRPDYERELLQRHNLRILAAEAPHPTRSNSHSYLHYLETALSRSTNGEVFIHRHPDYAGWLWADFNMGERVIRIGFHEQRLQNRVLLILPFLAAIGLFIAFALSVLLVRRITRPLATMADATHRIGKGDFSATIPESGPRELADLANRLNEMERRIGELLQNRTTLLAGISHDLRTPLARMRVELELLRDNDNTSLIQGLENDIAEMETLIAQTLLLARGLGKEEAAPTDVCALLDDVIDGFGRSGATIELDRHGECIVRLKAESLKRVLRNLVENAVSYGDGKPVRIAYHKGAHGMTIGVSDRGPGIPVAEREAIFEPFHRLEASRNRSTGGSGLGLAIVRQLCDANGWQVIVSAPAAGGTLFEVRIPA